MDKLSTNQLEKARRFMDFTGDSEKNAIETLKASLWQVESAYDMFYSQPRSKAEMRGYLEFVNNNIAMLTNFFWLTEQLKIVRLKALAETSPVATAQIADAMFPSIFKLLMENMPKQKSEENMDYAYIECLQYVLHHLDHNKTANDTPKFQDKDFKKRLKWVQHLTLAKMEKLGQTFSKQDKYFPKDWKSDPLKSLLKSSWEHERKRTKAEVRCCINILAMTKVLQGKATSFIQEDTVNLSWKESRSPPALKILSKQQHLAQKIPSNRDQLNFLSKDRRDFLQAHKYCYLNDNDVKKLLGLSEFQRLISNRNGSFLLNDKSQIGMLTWQIEESEFSSCFVKGRDSNKGISGKVRNQLYHLLCWAYASSDLVSAVRYMRKWEDKYYPLCTWYLSSFCCPEKLGTDKETRKPDEDGYTHHCYGYTIENALYHIQENGIPKEFVDTFLCTDHTPPTTDEPEKQSRRIIKSRRINSMKDAILELQKSPKQPIGADLIAYVSLFKNQLGKPQIYYGPRSKSDTFWGYHAVVIEDFQMINEELVAVCKMSNGELVADVGYVYVSVTTQYIPMGVCEKMMSSIRGSNEPLHLLTNFITVDMDVKEETDKEDEEEETDKENEEEEDTEEDDAKEDQEPAEEEEEEEDEHIHEAKRRRVRLGFNRFRSHFTHKQLLRVLGHGDAENLASLADLYVNYAFGTAHRAHASIEGVTKFLKPSVAGFLLQKVMLLIKHLQVVPASGIEDGWMGLDIGPDSIKTFNEALDTIQTVIWNGPMGVFEMEKFAAGTEGRPKGVTAKFSLAPLVPRLSELLSIEVVPASGTEDGWMGLDTGPDSIKTFNEALDTTQTVIWNGPMGVYEMEKFAAGTEAIANKLAELSEKGVTTIIGGRDSVAAVEKVGVPGVMSHISTGGGASLELFEGKVLPGVIVLVEASTATV